jgi:hypothetical protein
MIVTSEPLAMASDSQAIASARNVGHPSEQGGGQEKSNGQKSRVEKEERHMGSKK